MKECEYYQELISRLLDEDLTADEDAALKSHLESCAECRRMFEAFSAVSRLAGETEEPPEALSENIMAGIRRAEIKKKNRRLRPMLAAAACLAVVLLGAWGVRNTLFAEKAADLAVPMAAPAEAPCAAMIPEEPESEEEAAEAPDDTDAAMFTESAPAEKSAGTDSRDEGADMDIAVGAGYSCAETGGAPGEHAYLDAGSFEALLTFLAGEPADMPEGSLRLLCTAVCEPGWEYVDIYESGEELFYTDSLDGLWYVCACGREDFGNFFTQLQTK